MNKTLVLNVVGLSKSLIGEHTPFLKKWSEKRSISSINPVLPAVTTSMQSTYLTGKMPGQHGIVANGWYDREECEIKFWKQSNKLVQAEKIWEKAKKIDPDFTCSKMFWWYNMYSTADYSVTPRPQYRSDGRKMPDIYSHPAQLRDTLQKELGQFPLFNFWGPNTNIKSSRWIADASMLTDKLHDPTLTLIYLPHMDYNLQRYGTAHSSVAADLKEIDAVCADLIQYYESKGTSILLLSEYGISDVKHSISLNRIFRKKDWLSLRIENEKELLDAGACKVFALADHQIAHIYVNDASVKNDLLECLKNTKGIELVLDDAGKEQYGINHERSGDFVVVADKDHWFNYYYWLDDERAPDFARIVDIHRKPGYDPVEMFTDPDIRFLMPKVGWKLLKKKLGFRMLMDLIPLDASLIKGSHGRIHVPDAEKPLLITGHKQGVKENLDAVEVYDAIWQCLTD